MSIIIRLSEPLLKLRSRKDLVETLLHEMIHAWNFVRGVVQEENGGHGQNFLAKMHEINRLAGTNISVYHSFRDEVELYKTHWWRCDGACKNRRPYYGFVKRTTNLAPGPKDRWWSTHQSSCGGTFVKVKEPGSNKGKSTVPDVSKHSKPKPKDKNSNGSTARPSSGGQGGSKASEPQVPNNTTNKVPAGSVLGGSGNGRSRLLDLFDNAKKAQGTSPRNKSQNILDSFEENDDDIVLIDGEFDDNFPKPMILSPDVILVDSPGIPTNNQKIHNLPAKCNCPVCDAKIEMENINEHLDQCIKF